MDENLKRYMIWGIISLAFLLGAAVYSAWLAFGKYKRRRLLSPFQMFFLGVFISVVFSLIPLYNNLLFSLHHTLQVFSLDIDKDEVLGIVKTQAPAVLKYYTCYYSVMFFLAPLMTFGIIASFFKNFYAQFRLVWHRVFHGNAAVYAFSDLNRESLALARSIKENPDHKNASVLFAGAFRSDDENAADLLEDAREIRAICFKKDLLSIDFNILKKSSPLFFFAMNEENSNNKTAIRMAETYKNRDNTSLYLFSSGMESELLLSKNPGKTIIRRINPARSLISRELYQNGRKLFENSVALPDGSRKIHAVIVGMGEYGREMLKALSWFCQMEGYHLFIDAFGKDRKARSRFAREAPGLLDPSCNGVSVPGEAEYTIRIHSGCDFESADFINMIRKLTDATFVFVALGSDELDIRVAAELRTQFERMHIRPVIQALVYDSWENEAMKGVTNYSGQPYDIECVGDLKNSFSEKVILNPELEEEGLKIHSRYNPEQKEFWQYEYNYRSSMASAIHNKLRRDLGIAGAGKTEEEWTEEERERIESAEHRRWNAYMRSEGYVYSGSTDKASRNNLAKTHHNLVPFDKLNEEDKRKDGRVASR